MLQLADGKGPFTSTGIEALLYMKVNDSVNADPELPDIELLQSFATIGFDTGMPIYQRNVILHIRHIFHVVQQKNKPTDRSVKCER